MLYDLLNGPVAHRILSDLITLFLCATVAVPLTPMLYYFGRTLYFLLTDKTDDECRNDG